MFMVLALMLIAGLTRYMVVDSGGGTVDVTVHELNVLNGQLHELHKATGGPHGSCGIHIIVSL